MSAGEINHEALREIYPISLGSFIRKPIPIEHLVDDSALNLTYHRVLINGVGMQGGY